MKDGKNITLDQQSLLFLIPFRNKNKKNFNIGKDSMWKRGIHNLLVFTTAFGTTALALKISHTNTFSDNAFSNKWIPPG